MPSSPPYRVIQWATGNIGLRALEVALAHPEIDVVGVRVFDPAKVGVDIGTLVGGDPVGVAATDDVEALFALEADCVLYMPSVFHIDELCRMLESGTNVVTTCSALFLPRRSVNAASWCAPSRSPRCRSGPGATTTVRATAPRTTSGSPACGRRATSRRGPSTAGS